MSVIRTTGNVGVGVVSRVHGISRMLRQHVWLEWLPALGPAEIYSVVNVKGCVEDVKEKTAAQ